MQANTDWPLEMYPERIHQLKLEALKIERELDQLKAIRAERKNALKSTEWQSAGTNDKIRDANFELILSKDEVYKSSSQDIDQTEWTLNEVRFQIEKYESMLSIKKLRLREHIAGLELQATTGIVSVEAPKVATIEQVSPPVAETTSKSRFPF